MQDFLPADRPARGPLRVVPLAPRSLRITRSPRTIRITRLLRDMLLIAMDHIMGPDVALNIAITGHLVRETGVGLEAYLFRVAY